MVRGYHGHAGVLVRRRQTDQVTTRIPRESLDEVASSWREQMREQTTPPVRQASMLDELLLEFFMGAIYEADERGKLADSVVAHCAFHTVAMYRATLAGHPPAGIGTAYLNNNGKADAEFSRLAVAKILEDYAPVTHDEMLPRRFKLIPSGEPLDKAIASLDSGYSFYEDAHRRYRLLTLAAREHDAGDEDDGAIERCKAECERIIRQHIASTSNGTLLAEPLRFEIKSIPWTVTQHALDAARANPLRLYEKLCEMHDEAEKSLDPAADKREDGKP